ncbi:MAG: CoA-transferase subunit beta [Chloroflexi bacterium]|nr:CoA-transferase subunit beta [Chloroflexota bacterium]
MVHPSQGYRNVELMCIAAAREIRDGEVVLAGLGLPLLAVTLAKLLHAPGAVFLTEAGVMDWQPVRGTRAPTGIADQVMNLGSAAFGDMADALGCALMGGNVDVAFLGAAQVDRFGNLNTVVIGDYRDPVIKLGGTGGNTDAACLSRRTIVVMPHERRRFLERVDFCTSPGYLDGPGARGRAGLDPQGPNVVVSSKGILRFDTPDGGRTGSCEMVLEALFPGVSVEEVSEATGWPLRVSPHLQQVAPPTPEELALLRELDPLGSFLAEGRYR